MRLAGTKLAANHQYRGFGDQLYDLSGQIPSLDLNFANTKSLVDTTTGQNLVTFTRASSGTYVDGQGVIRTATTNLLLRSEEFDNASWTKIASTVLANRIQSPIGTLTADEIIEDLSTANHYAANNTIVSSVSGTVYTYSVYLKAGQRNFCFVLANGTGTLHSVSVNLSTGAATSAIGSPSNITSVSIGNGWYRVSFTYTSGTTGNVGHEVRLSTDGVWANRTYTGNGTGSIYAWGAQLEQSSTVGEYVPTTSTINSAPRFDHNPTTGESLGLLVEEQRTNLLLPSACDSNWPSGGFGTATYNLGLSALGVFSGVQIASAGQNWHSIYRTGISLTASTVYAFTLFYRAGTSGRVRLTFRNNTTLTETVINGLAGNLSVSGSFAGAATVLSQFLCLDGLTYVVTGTFTPNGTSADHWYRIGPDSTTSGQTVIALGGQLEAGSFPTSYIPTTTAAVTRSADVASITGSNFSSWYRQDEGTVFSEFSAATYSTASYAISDGTNSNRILVDRGSTGTRYVITNAGVGQSGGAQTPYTLNSFAKTSLGYALDNCNLAVGGVLQTLDTSATIPSTTDRLLLGVNAGGAGYGNGPIKRFTFWPRRLSDPTLQGITQ